MHISEGRQKEYTVMILVDGQEVFSHGQKGENNYKRKDGRWEGRYIIGRKSDGHARYASIYGRNYREVKEALERKKGEQYRAMPNCSLTVKALMAMWLSLRSTEIKASSYQHYLP